VSEGVEETVLGAPEGGDWVAGFGIAFVQDGVDDDVETFVCKGEGGQVRGAGEVVRDFEEEFCGEGVHLGRGGGQVSS
jgi:hypothetical protein